MSEGLTSLWVGNMQLVVTQGIPYSVYSRI